MTEEDNWIFDPGMASLNRSLKRQIRGEAEEVEAVIAESELRARTFADVALETRNRGELVSVVTSHRVFNGLVLYAAGDLVTMRTNVFEVDVCTADVAYMHAVDETTRGGRARQEGPGTFEMRLMERRSRSERVEIGLRNVKETVHGRLVAIGQDHVLVLGDHDREWTVPLTSVSYVIRRERPGRNDQR